MAEGDDKQVKNKGQPHRWKKGESGNPNGRPKKPLSLTSLLKDALDKVPEGEEHGRTNADLAIQALLKEAHNGNLTAIREILDRCDGKVPQPMIQAIHGEVTLLVKEDR